MIQTIDSVAPHSAARNDKPQPKRARPRPRQKRQRAPRGRIRPIAGQASLFPELVPLVKYCPRCGARLTSPQSLAAGIGPKCHQHTPWVVCNPPPHQK
jgi:hypothetical protein